MKIYRLILLEGKLWGHPSQLCLKPGKHPNCKRQIGIFFHLSSRSTGNLELSLFSQKVGQKITISIARNESKGVYWERLHLMSLVDGRFGSVLKSPLFYPFYWHEKYDSESSLFFENELTHLPEYDTFYFWVPAGIYRAETTVISTLRTYEWEQTIIGGVSWWNSQIMRLDPYSPTLMPHSHSHSIVISSFHTSALWSLFVLFSSIFPVLAILTRLSGNPSSLQNCHHLSSWCTSLPWCSLLAGFYSCL